MSVTGMLGKPLVVAALVLPTNRIQRLFALGACVLAAWHTYSVLLDAPGRKGFTDYVDPTSITGSLLVAVDLLLLRQDPRTSIKRTARYRANLTSSKSKAPFPLEGKSLADRPLVQRVIWATGLIHNPRLIGTTAQIPNVAPLSPELAASRKKFFKCRLFFGVTGFLRLAAFVFTVKAAPALKRAFISYEPSLFQRAIVTSIGITCTYFLLNAGHYVLSVVAVGSGFSDAEDWPDLFGKFSDAYTVRRAWGRVWHQLIRQPLSSVGTRLARSVGAAPGTIASRYIQLYVAFALSGWMHSGGDFIVYTNELPSNATMRDKFTPAASFSMWFFVLQAVGITFEDGVIALAERLLASSPEPADGQAAGAGAGAGEQPDVVFSPWVARLGTLIGYLWVFTFFSATFPEYCRTVLVYILT